MALGTRTGHCWGRTKVTYQQIPCNFLDKDIQAVLSVAIGANEKQFMVLIVPAFSRLLQIIAATSPAMDIRKYIIDSPTSLANGKAHSVEDVQSPTSSKAAPVKKKATEVKTVFHNP